MNKLKLLYCLIMPFFICGQKIDKFKELKEELLINNYNLLPDSLYGESDLINPATHAPYIIIGKNKYPNPKNLEKILYEIRTSLTEDEIAEYDSIVTTFCTNIEKTWLPELEINGNIISKIKLIKSLQLLMSFRIHYILIHVFYNSLDRYKLIVKEYYNFHCNFRHYKFDHPDANELFAKKAKEVPSFNNAIMKLIITTHLYWKDIYFFNYLEYEDYFIHDVIHAKVIDYDLECSIPYDSNAIYRSFYYILIESYEDNPSGKISNSIFTHYFDMDKKILGAARYLGIASNERTLVQPPINQTILYEVNK